MDRDVIEELSGQTNGLNINADTCPPKQPVGDGEAPCPPDVQSKGVVATDITANFTQAAHKLGVGQLIKDDFFTLFESVGAIEIMDPKMDTGFLAEGETMDDDYDLGQDLLPEEVLGIIDQLFCLEMAWHMGHPLSQTVFTSLYIDKLLDITQEIWEKRRFADATGHESLCLRTLRAYCLGLIMTCSVVNNRIKSEHFYEEEDLVTHTYNRSLLEGVEPGQVIECLLSVESELTKSKLVPQAVQIALRCRLSFRATLLQTVTQTELRDLSIARQLWDDLNGALPDSLVYHELAVAVPEAFSVKLQRKLASTVPPRPVVEIAFQTAYDHLERFCRDGRAMVEVLDYHDSHSLLTFVFLFYRRKPQPSVYIRALHQYYIFGEMMVLGKLSIRQLLDDDLASIVLADDQLLDRKNDEIEVPHDPRFKMAQSMEAFRERAAHTYLDVLRTLCQNRCRTRRDLTHCIMDWDALQMDAEELDVQLREWTKEKPVVDPDISNDPIHAFPLSSWTYFYKLRQMEWIVQLGFELEVYSTDELAGMYWYLRHLTRTRMRHLERIRGFTMRRLKAATGRSKKTTPQTELGFVRALSYINYSMLEATAIHGFADALTCLYTVLDRKNLLNRPPRPYSNEALRYELRMKPFLGIVLPEFLPYDTFHIEVTQPEECTADLLEYAAEATMQARKDFELLSKLDSKTASCLGSEEAWTQNIKDSMKACIMASLQINTVKKALKGETTIKVETENRAKGYHDWWVVPQIVVVKK